MKKLHPLQEKIFQIFKENDGNLPSFREIARIIKVASTNTVAYHINQLKKEGYFEINNSDKGIVRLNLKTLLNFENKSGVYVLLKNKKPIYVEEALDIKNDILGKFIKNDSLFLEELKKGNENISIAYSIIKDQDERNELKNYLRNIYRLSNPSQ